MVKLRCTRQTMQGDSEKGVALVAALLLLLAITLLVVSNMQASTTHQRMTSNLHDHQLAMQNAEAALVEAETLLEEAPLPAGPLGLINDAGIYDVADPGEQVRWASANEATVWLDGPDMGDERVSTAQYIIEYMGEWPFPPECDQVSTPPQGCLQPIFRITARVPAANGRAEVILQSIWRG